MAQTVFRPSFSVTAQHTFMHCCGLCEPCGRDKSVLYFTAKWCPPCRRIGPFFAELSEDTPNVTFGKVDIDDNPDATSMANVMSVPTFKFYKVRPFLFFSSSVSRNIGCYHGCLCACHDSKEGNRVHRIGVTVNGDFVFCHRRHSIG